MNYVVESYENYKEEDRLTTNNARKIEFITTTRVLDEVIDAESKILDCCCISCIRWETNVLWQLIIFMNVCMRMRKCGLMIMNMRLSVRQKKWHYL